MRRPTLRLVLSLSLFAILLVVGTLWYGIVEHFGLLDAIYQVVTTISTVGYSEVQPLDTSGRIFTIGFILVGIGVMFYVAGRIVEELVVGGVADTLSGRRQRRRSHRMKDHIVICGLGRVGREVAAAGRERGRDVVAIDIDPQTAEAAEELGCVVIVGDATDEAILKEAHVERARALVAAAAGDAVNTFIVLTARDLNPRLNIVARAGSEAAERRMETAGATTIVSPYQIAGRRMALAVAQPMLIDFIDSLVTRPDGRSEVLAELQVDAAGERLRGRPLMEVFGGRSTRVLAIVHEDGELVVAPNGSTTLRGGDRLMVYGEQSDLETITAGS